MTASHGHRLFDLLLREIDEQVRQYQDQHGQWPSTVVLPRGRYILLEDYCRELEVTRLTEAMMQLATVRGDAARWQQQKQAAQAALERLRRQGITELVCSFCTLAVRVDAGRDELGLE
ncbi:hypothetical protein [Alicyclobacillus shizuokensis]|uniref:hypothetical protein n=1 Tax=Alicyclobacillus shizuokensis TaxID=392014 RepID=UPI00082F51F9|nr:hypothetical protein [Alicyclobacillus shizuokensis]MCL6626195.1 hypothetical protein [Alicyclobacillus shizuokensis]